MLLLLNHKFQILRFFHEFLLLLVTLAVVSITSSRGFLLRIWKIQYLLCYHLNHFCGTEINVFVFLHNYGCILLDDTLGIIYIAYAVSEWWTIFVCYLLFFLSACLFVLYVLCTSSFTSTLFFVLNVDGWLVVLPSKFMIFLSILSIY